MIRVDTIEDLRRLYDVFRVHKGWTNNFLLEPELEGYINTGRLFSVHTQSNFLLLVDKGDFFRGYYTISDPDESIDLDISFPIVFEILYRGDKRKPTKEIEYWLSQGFVIHLNRENFFLNATEVGCTQFAKSDIQYLKYKSDIKAASFLINEHLDHYTGDMLSEDELQVFSDQNLLFGIYDDERLAGVLQAELKNNVFWLGHLVIDQRFQGLGLSHQLMEAYFREGLHHHCRQFQLWVISDNIPAIKLYSKYGFVSMNRSTQSMIKMNNGKNT